MYASANIGVAGDSRAEFAGVRPASTGVVLGRPSLALSRGGPLDASGRVVVSLPQHETAPQWRGAVPILLVCVLGDLRRMFRMVLEAHGFEVREASEPSSVVQAITSANWRPQVIVLDLEPLMSWTDDVLEAIQVPLATYDLPVVGVASVPLIGRAQIERYQSLGVREFVTKPFTHRDLVATILRSARGETARPNIGAAGAPQQCA